MSRDATGSNQFIVWIYHISFINLILARDSPKGILDKRHVISSQAHTVCGMVTLQVPLIAIFAMILLSEGAPVHDKHVIKTQRDHSAGKA